MKVHCDVIQDLLPLVVDGVCSEKTKQVVEEHLLECDQCREIALTMKELEEKPTHVEAKQPWLKVKKRNTLKVVVSFVIAPILCVVLYVSGCTLRGEGLTWDALMYRRQANQFLDCFALSNYEEASQYLSFYQMENVEQQRQKWTQKMEELDLDIQTMQFHALNCDDGIAQTWVTLTTDDTVIEFRLAVQGKGLSVSSIDAKKIVDLQGQLAEVEDTELTEVLQQAMTAHNAG